MSKSRWRYDAIRSSTERERNAKARHDYRERQRKHAWSDAMRVMAECFDRDQLAVRR